MLFILKRYVSTCYGDSNSRSSYYGARLASVSSSNDLPRTASRSSSIRAKAYVSFSRSRSVMPNRRSYSHSRDRIL